MQSSEHDHEMLDSAPDGTPIFKGPDGLAEADHPMPRWMVMVFWGTIAWGLGYLVLMPGMGINLLGYSQYGTYEREVAEAKARYAGAQSGDLATLVAAAAADPAAAERGKAAYQASCAACHGADGGGAIGPSFKDAEWTYGSEPVAIAHTIASGTAKGMPPFENTLAPAQLAEVTAYIQSLRAD